jgi:Abortive infection alpha
MDDQAKAAGEIAKTVGKGIDAAREAGGFLAKYIGRPLDVAMEIVTDRLRYIRLEQQVRLLVKANTILEIKGSTLQRRPVPLNLAIPILEDGSLQEDESLQDIWAQLLANAVDATSGVEIRRAFLTILNDLSPLDAKNLKKIYEVSDPIPHHGGIATFGLPHKAFARTFKDCHELALETEIELSMRNLVRLGLVDPIILMDGGSAVTVVLRTELGRQFVRACSG